MSASAQTSAALCRDFPFGALDVRGFSPRDDIAWFHDWVRRDYAKFWGMTEKSPEAVAAEYDRLLARPGYEVVVGRTDGTPRFVGELYDPRTDPVGEVYDPRDTDRGIHFIAAPRTGPPQSGFTGRALSVVLALAFERPGIERVLVEPDHRNEKMVQLCRRLGFDAGRIVTLPDKQARLMFLDRRDFKP
ncbi:MAG: GNAT family N-acetyltransferase [Myxococcota bacterium]